jgi:hypothetical protein
MTFRPDLTQYEWLVTLLTDKLNEDGLYKMSKTDAVKIAIERAVEKLAPGVIVKIKPVKRKRYIKLDY